MCPKRASLLSLMTAYMSDRPVFLATDEFVTVPVQGYRTGYVYREPAVPQADEGKQVQHSEVVVPPTVSSYTYSFEEDTGREATYVTSWSILMCAFVFFYFIPALALPFYSINCLCMHLHTVTMKELLVVMIVVINTGDGLHQGLANQRLWQVE